MNGDKEELVSVIVPIYNAENELKKCLDSIVNQSYQSLEILLIDDGSQDLSMEIANKYMERDNRIKCFHQKNSGVSAARNLGIDESNGKYLAFIDADDWVNSDFIKRLVETIQGGDLAIVSVSDGIHEPIRPGEKGEISRDSFFYYILCKIQGSCWNKLFIRSKVEDEKIRFPENVFYSEDTIFVMNYYLFCSKVIYCDEILYHYEYNGKSVTHKSELNNFNLKRLTLLILSEKLDIWYKNENYFITSCMAYRRVRTCIYLVYHMIVCKDYKKEVAEKVKLEIKKSYLQFIKFNKAGVIEKIAATGIYFSPKFVYIVGNIGYRVSGKFVKTFHISLIR